MSAPMIVAIESDPDAAHATRAILRDRYGRGRELGAQFRSGHQVFLVEQFVPRGRRGRVAAPGPR